MSKLDAVQLVIRFYANGNVCAASFIMGNPYYSIYFILIKNHDTMKVFIISFGTNPGIVAKFQTDRCITGDENWAGKK